MPVTNFPRTGHYLNDCPFCKTHNAILLERFGDQAPYFCRDCKRRFALVGQVDKDNPGEWVFTEPEPTADITGKAFAGSVRPFKRDDGEELTKEEVLQDLNATIKELRNLLTDTCAFLAKVETGMLREGESYLSFSIVAEEGYDRTGPSFVTAEPVGIKVGDHVQFVQNVHQSRQPDEVVLADVGQTGVVVPCDTHGAEVLDLGNSPEYLEVKLDTPNASGCEQVGCYTSDVQKI